MSPEVEAYAGGRLSDMGTKSVLVVAVNIGSDLVAGVLIVITSLDSVVVVLVVVVVSMGSKEI